MHYVIRSLRELARHNRPGQIVKYSMNGGQTWKYVKLLGRPLQEFVHGERGYPANQEVGPDGVHAYRPLTEGAFHRGMVVLPVWGREAQGKKWSYE